MTATRFPPHGPVLVRTTPAGRWLCCALCERIRFAASDDAAKAFLGAHDPEPDLDWLAQAERVGEGVGS